MNHIGRFFLSCTIAVIALAGNQAFTQTAQKAKPTAQTSAPKPKTIDQKSNQPSDQDLNIRAYIELLRSDVKSEATAIVAEVMQLDDKEGAVFWPIYREYELQLSKQWDNKLELIHKYADKYDSMSDDLADQLARGALELEQARLNLKQQYYERMKQALSAKTAARFLQINNQILMLIDLQVASALPVVK